VIKKSKKVYKISLQEGDVIIAFAETPPTGDVMGQSIFKVIHQKSKEEIYVSLEDLKEK